MDNFIDRLAQKFIAGEVIRANSAAEERELKRLREQVAEYERCLQEMRKIQLTNTQSAQNLHDMMVENADGIRKLTQESLGKLANVQLEADAQNADAKKAVDAAATAMAKMEEQVLKMQETVASLSEDLNKNQEEMKECFEKADDFLHKENVKVYRNVQAVVVEEVGNKAQEIIKASEEAASKASKPVLVFAVLGFVMAAASLVFQIFEYMGKHTSAKIIGFDAVVTTPDVNNPKADKQLYDTIKDLDNFVGGFNPLRAQYTNAQEGKLYDEKFKGKFSIPIDSYINIKEPPRFNSLSHYPQGYFNSLPKAGSVWVLTHPIDGFIKDVPQLVYYKGDLYPSLGLRMYAKLNNATHIKVTKSHLIVIGDDEIKIPIHRRWGGIFNFLRFYKNYKNSKCFLYRFICFC